MTSPVAALAGRCVTSALLESRLSGRLQFDSYPVNIQSSRLHATESRGKGYLTTRTVGALLTN